MKSELSYRITLIISGIALLVFIGIALASFDVNAAENRTGKLFLGTSLGVQSDTADDTAFAVGLYGDYYLTPNFSIGPLLQMGFTNDLSQFGLTAQAKYTFDIAGMPKLKPHVQAGLGLIYADIDNWREGNRDDTSYLIPLGIGAEYRLSDSVLLDGSIMVNFNDLDFRDGDSFVTWFIGVKFPL